MKFLCLFFLFFSFNLLAQEYTSGLVLDDEKYELLPRQTTSDGSKSNLPPVTDLKPFCPEIRNQGEIYSCVGWSVGYGAMTIEKAIQYNCTDPKIIAHNAYSALYLFNQINQGHCDKGSRISDAIEFLVKNGNCHAREFDFDVNDCEKQPTDSLKKKSQGAAIHDFQTLFGIAANPKFKTWKVRQALAHQKPVVIGMNVRKNFYQLKDARFWWPDKGNTTPAGGHAMVVIGYDDYKGAFQLMNSWGKSWGNKGFIWVKYKDFGTFCKYAYILQLEENSQQVQQNQGIWVEGRQNVQREQLLNQRRGNAVLSDANHKREVAVQTNLPKTNERPLRKLAGDFAFEEFIGFEGMAPKFRKANVEFNKNKYVCQRKNWKTGTRFQLVVKNSMTTQYIYVFSVDAKEKVEIHFPKRERLNPKFKGINESPLVVAKDVEMLIPGLKNGQHQVLNLAEAGTDHLCVLFSTEKIPNRFLKELSQRMRGHQADFIIHLQHLLGDKLIPAVDINYWREDIGFEVNTRSKGVIVPLILEVEAF